MIDTIISDLVGQAVKNKVAPQTTRVEHVYPNQAPALQPAPSQALGEPDMLYDQYGNPIMRQSELLTEMEREPEPFHVPSFGDPLKTWGRNMANDIRRLGEGIRTAGSYGDPNASGGPVGWVRDQLIGGINQTAGAVEAVTGQTAMELDGVKDTIAKLVVRLRDVERSSSSNSNQVRGANTRIVNLTRQVSALSAKQAAEDAKQGTLEREQIERGLLALAQALPGVYAHNQLNSTQHAALVTVIEEYGKAFGIDMEGDADEITLSTVTAANATYDQTAQNTMIGELKDRDDEILAEVHKLKADFYGMIDKASAAGTADAVADWKKVVTPNGIINIAKLVPHQIKEGTAALVEALAKNILGSPGGTNGLFNLTIGTGVA